MNIDNYEHLICQCRSPEHTISLVYFGDPHGPDIRENDPNIYALVHLNHFGFWKRFWVAIKYVMGYTCRFGHWDEFMLRPEELSKLIRVLETAQPEEPMLTAEEGLSKLKFACQGKQDDTACCAVAGLMAAGRQVDCVEDQGGLTITVRSE